MRRGFGRQIRGAAAPWRLDGERRYLSTAQVTPTTAKAETKASMKRFDRDLATMRRGGGQNGLSREATMTQFCSC